VSQPPEKKVSEQILEEIAKLSARLDSLTTSQKHEVQIPTAAPSAVSSDDTQQQTHKTIAFEAIECVNCFPEVRDKVIQKHRDNTKEEKLECEGCGSGVKEEWKNCPLCGGSKAKRRD